MKRNTKKFLTVSFSLLAIACIVLISVTSSVIAKKSDFAINEIGSLYMSAMAKQMQEKFDTVVDMRISELNGIIERHPPESVAYDQDMFDQLALSAQVRDFVYLGLYTEDGESETVYGSAVEYDSEITFRNVLDDSSLRVFAGTSAEGEKVLCMLVNAQYPMRNGKTSWAIVAATPMADLEKVLTLDEEMALMYSFIIRADGTYVVRNREETDFFTYIRQNFSDHNGKSAEAYVEELRDAMSRNAGYSTMFREGDENKYLLCTDLTNSEWFLISVMPHGTLDRILEDLGFERQLITLIMAVFILAGVMVIFILYYRLSQQQMQELDEARKEATKANKAKIESGKLTLNMSQISLHDAMDSIVNIVQPQVKSRQQHFDIFIQNIITEEVHCDSVRLNQVLINLLSNALKFTPEGGVIKVFLSQEESPVGENYVRCHFRVKDNGIGMTEEFQEKIFDTFTREEKAQINKIEGTGLGMAITKAIVQAMKGTIDLQSAPGEGSEFHITLDLEKADTKEADMMLPSWRVLVADNNEDLCLSAVSSLKEIGINADWATDGKKAVEMVRKCHEEDQNYEVVLLDWKMPDMDGLHTAREMRKLLGQKVPILIISAYDWSDIEEEAREVGIQGFISKPLFKSNLYLGLKRYMLDEVDEEEHEDAKIQKFVGKRILLAEDNDLNWEIAEDLLSEAGFELERAENGKICVEKFEQSETGFYNVILMDIRMPVMNGYDAAKAIRALAREDACLPIIAMTADAFSDDIQHCLDCGMNEHVAKPIDVNRLTQLLRRYL